MPAPVRPWAWQCRDPAHGQERARDRRADRCCSRASGTRRAGPDVRAGRRRPHLGDRCPPAARIRAVAADLRAAKRRVRRRRRFHPRRFRPARPARERVEGDQVEAGESPAVALQPPVRQARARAAVGMSSRTGFAAAACRCRRGRRHRLVGETELQPEHVEVFGLPGDRLATPRRPSGSPIVAAKPRRDSSASSLNPRAWGTSTSRSAFCRLWSAL